VALLPTNLNDHASIPDIVFSEACYGANIFEKTTNQSIAMQFLARGSRSFVGSTCIAYGSVGRPLIGADLLAHQFWTHIQNGVPSGYALMRAKLDLASSMVQSQGYLDGEDQKTLLSFELSFTRLKMFTRNPKNFPLFFSTNSCLDRLCSPWNFPFIPFFHINLL